MIDIIQDTLIDSLKLLPFLFLAFIFMEYLEHKISNKKYLEKTNKLGPLIGSLLGAFPQCGFGAAATNLYATRVITLGTLISVYLSTSDEMLPILLSEKVDIKIIIIILLFKIIIGMISGFIIDLIIRKKEHEHIHDICENEHCDCEHGILKSSIKHTLNILFFITIISFILNFIMANYGEQALESMFFKNNIFSPFIASLIGLIPNCASSVVITQLYLNNALTFGSTIAGLLTGSGIALLILFKQNKDIKENIKILLIIYFIGAISGVIVNLLNIVI
ncbi:MAG: putative manganese transporter [Bacilli bacterium]|nr:putative manganese transporter [Bacilli bacterium]